jgi:hypothetical protein
LRQLLRITAGRFQDMQSQPLGSFLTDTGQFSDLAD